jgi:pimeloyl-ACP methyl ester carboxylesterase
MPEQSSEAAAPSLAHFLREAGALFDLHWRSLLPPRLERAERKGQRVVVIPGFLAGDHSTLLMRRALDAAGYDVEGWDLGVNWGARGDLLDRLEERLTRTASSPAALVGWSLGGVYARELAKRAPARVARVITLGSPFSGDLRANNAWRLYELLNHHKVDAPPIEVTLGTKPPVPTIAIWSRQDGIVAPASARGEPHESDLCIEVQCSHMGFMTAACALEAVLEQMKG